MNLKSILVLGLKIVVLTAVMCILFSIGSAVLTGEPATAQQASPGDAAASLLSLLFVCLIDTAILTYFILRSRLSGWRLMVVVALVFYGVKTFTSMLEAWYFMADATSEGLLGLFVFTVPMVVIWAPLAVWMLGKAKRQPEADEAPNTRMAMPVGQLVAKVAFLSVIVYSALFWSFGFYIALRNPDLAAFYGVTRPDRFIDQLAGLWATDPIVFVFEFFRGALWIAMAAPIIRTTKGKVWEAGLIVALLFALVQNDVHLIYNPLMPRSVAMSHFWETASSNAIYAAIIVWLMHRRHSSLRDLFSVRRPAAQPAPSAPQTELGASNL
jgi:hypothetical protein